VPPSDSILKMANIGGGVVGFSLAYKGPGQRMLRTIWLLCGPALFSLISVAVLDSGARIMLLFSATIRIAESLLYFSAAIWFLAIFCACVATVALTLPFSLKRVPARVMWGGCLAVAINWSAIGLAYLLFLLFPKG